MNNTCTLTGPLRASTGPNDHEGEGRERFWDMSPEQRSANLSRIVQMTRPESCGQDKAFARGWLSEHARMTTIEST